MSTDWILEYALKLYESAKADEKALEIITNQKKDIKERIRASKEELQQLLREQEIVEKQRRALLSKNCIEE